MQANWIDGQWRPAAEVRGDWQAVDPRSGEHTLLYSECNGHKLSAPNDLVFDTHGGFYFTDLGKRREREAYRQVAGGVIHHINNLLASIRGYSEMIQGLPELDERGRRAVQQIALGTERGERLTSQLMAFTHAGARSATVESLDALVEEACDVAAACCMGWTVLKVMNW